MIRTLALQGMPHHRAAHRVAARPETSARSRNDEYFNQFMSELTKHYMQERSVGFYAGQLHLTPKYLTTIIRKTSGRTAVQWIDDYVVLEAKNLLKYSTMSIQEISYYLNFPNQSFSAKVFPQPHGHDPVGIPDEQIAGGFAAVRPYLWCRNDTFPKVGRFHRDARQSGIAAIRLFRIFCK